MRYIDLSHRVSDGMDVFPGFERPRITAALDHERSRPRYQDAAEFYISKMEMVGNTATYVDSPFHRYRDGRDLADVPLEDVAGLPGLVLDGTVGPDRAVSVEADESELAGRAVLVRTGWDERWGTEAYWEPGPYIAREVLELLLRARPKLVGVDFWNVDDIDDPGRRVHTRLLAEEILIVENLCNLGALPETGFRVFAVPVAVVTGASLPVRAFAEL
jgi:kynurenine formamidase